MNLYEYVMSNPANYIDPWGLTGIGNSYSPDQLQKWLTDPYSKDTENVCNDEFLCTVSDLLTFKEGRLTLLMYMNGGAPALEHNAMGMTGVNVANALDQSFMLNGELILGDYGITAGDVREPFKRGCYLKQCDERMKGLAEFVFNAIGQVVGGRSEGRIGPSSPSGPEYVERFHGVEWESMPGQGYQRVGSVLCPASKGAADIVIGCWPGLNRPFDPSETSAVQDESFSAPCQSSCLSGYNAAP